MRSSRQSVVPAQRRQREAAIRPALGDAPAGKPRARRLSPLSQRFLAGASREGVRGAASRDGRGPCAAAGSPAVGVFCRCRPCTGSRCFKGTVPGEKARARKAPRGPRFADVSTSPGGRFPAQTQDARLGPNLSKAADNFQVRVRYCIFILLILGALQAGHAVSIRTSPSVTRAGQLAAESWGGGPSAWPAGPHRPKTSECDTVSKPRRAGSAGKGGICGEGRAPNARPPLQAPPRFGRVLRSGPSTPAAFKKWRESRISLSFG